VRESVIEAYLVKRVKALGGEVRKVRWQGRSKAPDRLVLVPERRNDRPGAAFGWLPAVNALVEVKNPGTIATFPADAHERAQEREHKRLRKVGARVEVIGTIEGVDRLLDA
jgi:hypothetical protein